MITSHEAQVIEISGAPALSPFRSQKLLDMIQDRVPTIMSLYTEFIHFAWLYQPLTDREQDVLRKLLTYGPNRESDTPSLQPYLVVPRPSTISPWSSKATDIARGCGINKIKRLERGILYFLQTKERDQLPSEHLDRIAPLFYDRMTQVIFHSVKDAKKLFAETQPKPFRVVDIINIGKSALLQTNQELGLALTDDEMDYVQKCFLQMGRNPTDVELMMFAQVNSEHCRHKIFNANWRIDGIVQPHSLFDMISNTYKKNSEGVLSAYSDNSAVFTGSDATFFFSSPETNVYQKQREEIHFLLKVETHNHPTAISPYPGAATGSGGEIRDEGATGRGAKPKAGLTGFSVSNLKIPGFEQAWEIDYGKPDHIVSALDIMLEGPIGGASFNNEFGRPNIAGYFRTFEQKTVMPNGEEVRGYHKPIMLAGGLGSIRPMLIKKSTIPKGAKIVVVGGPAMLIGLGGGAASSMASGTSSIDLDFASVQRDNPEIQRRCQEVIDRCNALGNESPILSIHDVGAGGLSNALPELVYGSHRGASFELRSIPNAEPSMSPMEIWCNESQERYVLAVQDSKIDIFKAIAERERCPYAILGESTHDERLVLMDSYYNNTPIDLPLSILFGKPPKMIRDVQTVWLEKPEFKFGNIDIRQAAIRVLHLPCVADKTFLITIGDRTVTGLISRDQMVGPWQIPVADAAVTLTDYDGYTGEAMAIGERSPLSLISSTASARMAVAEAITNLASVPIESLRRVKLSANWMAAAGHPGVDPDLYRAVEAIGMKLCPDIHLTIPVGKDSMSLRTIWQQDGVTKSVVAPISLVVTACSRVIDVRRTLTPELRKDRTNTQLLLIDLGGGKNRLGGSALSQVYSQIGKESPDLSEARLIENFFNLIQALNREGLLLAYHDRSDGGLFVTLCEMAFASKSGLTICLDSIGKEPLPVLFNEELGAVVQIELENSDLVGQYLAQYGLDHLTHPIAKLRDDDRIVIQQNGKPVLSDSRIHFQKAWAETTYHMQSLRDNSQCALEEFQKIDDANDPGLNAAIQFDLSENISAPYIARNHRPKVAILRDQGVNGQIEMAAAFDRAGFLSVDVHMSDIINQRVELDGFHGLAACGGFSYGDVLGAGLGWAKSILFNPPARDQFESFFHRSNTFTLGICNGCQMIANLSELIPGSDHWPRFVQNMSEQFEARLVLVEVQDSPSVVLKGMAGSRIPIATAHGEGRAEFVNEKQQQAAEASKIITLRYVNNYGRVTEHYPQNPNGSPKGITGLCSTDGRVTIMMPHPERLFRTVQYSWHPREWDEDAPWLRLFQNARVWVS